MCERAGWVPSKGLEDPQPHRCLPFPPIRAPCFVALREAGLGAFSESALKHLKSIELLILFSDFLEGVRSPENTAAHKLGMARGMARLPGIRILPGCSQWVAADPSSRSPTFILPRNLKELF